jgi:hypothetical protein
VICRAAKSSSGVQSLFREMTGLADSQMQSVFHAAYAVAELPEYEKPGKASVTRTVLFLESALNKAKKSYERGEITKLRYEGERGIRQRLEHALDHARNGEDLPSKRTLQTWRDLLPAAKQAVAGIDQAVDELAEKTGVDRTELKSRFEKHVRVIQESKGKKPRRALPDGYVLPKDCPGDKNTAHAIASLVEETRPRTKKELETQSIERAATKHGVTPEQLRAAMKDVPVIRAQIRDEARSAAKEAFEMLDRAEAWCMAKPLTAKQRGPGQPKGGEYDWLEQVSGPERKRLQKGFRSDTSGTPDIIAERLREQGHGTDMSDSEIITDIWLPANRRAAAGLTLSQGKVPSERVTSNQIDLNELAPDTADTGYDVNQIMGAMDMHDAAGHVAAVKIKTQADEAWRTMGPNACTPTEGPAVWTMDYETWEFEVREIESRLNDQPPPTQATKRALRQRLDEIIPPDLDDPVRQYKELHNLILTTAREAGLHEI